MAPTPLSPQATELLEIPGAEDIWQATAWNPANHDETFAFVAKGCRSKEMTERAEALQHKYRTAELPPCVYVERMFVFKVPRGDGVIIYSPVPITDDLEEQVMERGGAKVIIIPNSEHVEHYKGWIKVFPDALVICPGGERMEPIITELGDRAKVLDFQYPSRWNKDAIKALSGNQVEVLSTEGFQEILLMHRNSRTLMACDSIYLSSSKKEDPEGMNNFAAQEWRELYWDAYMSKSPCFLPIYRTCLTPDYQKAAGKVWKKVIGWKADRVGSSRSGTVSSSNAKETKKILEGHWNWCVKSFNASAAGA